MRTMKNKNKRGMPGNGNTPEAIPKRDSRPRSSLSYIEEWKFEGHIRYSVVTEISENESEIVSFTLRELAENHLKERGVQGGTPCIARGS